MYEMKIENYQKFSNSIDSLNKCHKKCSVSGDKTTADNNAKIL